MVGSSLLTDVVFLRSRVSEVLGIPELTHRTAGNRGLAVRLPGFKVAVTLIFVLIPTVPRTSTTYLLLGKITSKIYVSQFFVPVQYFPLTNFLPWCIASNF